MGNRRIGVIVGNGLTLSLLTGSELLEEWHPQAPFSWEIPTPGRVAEPLLANLPHLNCLLAEIESQSSIPSDFDMFREIDSRIRASTGKKLPYASRADTETRHYLSIAFSHFDRRVGTLAIRHWSWGEWFRDHRKYLRVAVSFNYDLVLERTLKRLSIPYTRHFDGRDGLLLVKPHGSIDFEMATGPRASGYPLNIYNSWNDGPIYILARGQCTHVRREPVLVMPLERSRYRRLSGFRPVLQRYVREAKSLTDLVVIGHSDAEADQPEIDWLIGQTLTDCNVVLANPAPPTRLVSDLRRAGRRAVIWPAGPKELPQR